tara:strand:- start:2293 stop:2598 length:306 start_codon:yes stop_codon:yes gene_type:complete
MKINDFMTMCANHRKRVDKQLQIAMNHILTDPKCIRALRINSLDNTIDIQLVKEVRFLFLQSLVKHLKPKMSSENRIITNIIRSSLSLRKESKYDYKFNRR